MHISPQIFNVTTHNKICRTANLPWCFSYISQMHKLFGILHTFLLMESRTNVWKWFERKFIQYDVQNSDLLQPSNHTATFFRITHLVISTCLQEAKHTHKIPTPIFLAPSNYSEFMKQLRVYEWNVEQGWHCAAGWYLIYLQLGLIRESEASD